MITSDKYTGYADGKRTTSQEVTSTRAEDCLMLSRYYTALAQLYSGDIGNSEVAAAIDQVQSDINRYTEYLNGYDKEDNTDAI